MHAFYFGSSSRQLFGVYHPARLSSTRAAVICQPIGHEYIRAHRVLRNTASRLSAAGVHVLRFDYCGCGDSAGESADGRVPRWIEDVGTAIDELKDTVGVPKISLLGLRFGATLAALASAGRTDTDALILCDPVIDGSAYVQSVLRLQREWLASRPFVKVPRSCHEDGEMIGFPLSADLRRDLEGVDLGSLQSWPARRVVAFWTDGTASGTLPNRLAGSTVAIDQRPVPVDCRWSDFRAVHLGLLASELVEAIGGLFERGAAE